MKEAEKLVKLETQMGCLSGSINSLNATLDRNTDTLGGYGKNLTEIFTVQKTLCKNFKELNKSIKKQDIEVKEHNTDIAVLQEKFKQFKRLGITASIAASIFVGCVGAFKFLHNVFPY